VYLEVPRNRGKNTTLMASMSVGGLWGSAWGRKGRDHEGYLQGLRRAVTGSELAGRGQVVVMDNLCAHKGQRVREMIEARGSASSSTCRALLAGVQPYRGGVLEDQGFAAKGRLAHPREALIEALGTASRAVGSTDALGFLEHCGYRRLVHLL